MPGRASPKGMAFRPAGPAVTGAGRATPNLDSLTAAVYNVSVHKSFLSYHALPRGACVRWVQQALAGRQAYLSLEPSRVGRLSANGVLDRGGRRGKGLPQARGPRVHTRSREVT